MNNWLFFAIFSKFILFLYYILFNYGKYSSLIIIIIIIILFLFDIYYYYYVINDQICFVSSFLFIYY